MAIVSPYDTTARYARHSHIIAWRGFAAQLTETRASESVKLITDVATTPATTNDAQALPGIPTPGWRVAVCLRPSTRSP